MRLTHFVSEFVRLKVSYKLVKLIFEVAGAGLINKKLLLVMLSNYSETLTYNNIGSRQIKKNQFEELTKYNRRNLSAGKNFVAI